LKNSFSENQDNQLLAFSKNIPIEKITQAKNLVSQVRTEYKGDNFNADIQKFVKEFKSNPKTQ